MENVFPISVRYKLLSNRIYDKWWDWKDGRVGGA